MKYMTGQWLEAAHDDLAAIEKLVNDDTLTRIASFHAQQASSLGLLTAPFG